MQVKMDLSAKNRSEMNMWKVWDRVTDLVDAPSQKKLEQFAIDAPEIVAMLIMRVNHWHTAYKDNEVMRQKHDAKIKKLELRNKELMKQLEQLKQGNKDGHETTGRTSNEV